MHGHRQSQKIINLATFLDSRFSILNAGSGLGSTHDASILQAACCLWSSSSCAPNQLKITQKQKSTNSFDFDVSIRLLEYHGHAENSKTKSKTKSKSKSKSKSKPKTFLFLINKQQTKTKRTNTRFFFLLAALVLGTYGSRYLWPRTPRATGGMGFFCF